jgi:hypothetical protein
MNCSRCGYDIPADAVFCIYCAARVRPEVETEAHVPATGDTIQLDPAAVPALPAKRHRSVSPRQGRRAAVIPAATISTPPRQKRKHRRHADPSGPLFLIGLFVLLVTNNFWPGILVLVAVTHFIREQARGRDHKALRDLIFWGGLAVLFWTHTFWPGILLLLLATSLIRKRHFAWRP